MSSLAAFLNPLIHRELAAIAATEAAVTRQTDPGYSFLYTESKLEKQANVTQMSTLLRLAGKGQTALLQAVDTTATLRAMRMVGRELVQRYTETIAQVEPIARAGLRKALSRAIVQDTVLSAHIARRTGHPSDSEELPQPLDAYFAANGPRVCMRCLLDRPHAVAALERGEPRPYQYICAACHHEVFEDIPPDLRSQAHSWPEELREDLVIHRALSRPERLRAVHEVLYPLSGLAFDIPEPASSKPFVVPDTMSTPPPRKDAPDGVLTIDPIPSGRGVEEPEEQYVQLLFEPLIRHSGKRRHAVKAEDEEPRHQ
jgi:hypothetical protein